MTDKQLSTTREALMAELLIDVDRLLNKVSELDQSLGETIKQSTKDAASKGFLAASLQMKRFAEDLEIRIGEASSKSLQSSSPQNNRVQTNLPQSGFSQRFSTKLYVLGFAVGFLGSLSGQAAWALLLKLSA